jgi:hypothetical protein
VTADTSAVDILKAAAQMMRHDIDPATSILVECYFLLGLERRLRRYEGVRDVMNSWDRDQQNTLLIMPRDSATSDQDLELKSIPRTEEPPKGFCMQLHHSSKPGKWDKRWVTLLENGQIYAAKSENAKPSDKESTVLCHLTDFDIYAPKESEMRRNLRPPKQFCYAIKSQQKTVVFANGENFMHFFSTDDAQQASCFYAKVHAWRSWYLVNRIVDLEKKSKAPQIGLDLRRKNTTSTKRSIKSGGSSGTDAPSLAKDESTEPLMNVNAFRMSQIVIGSVESNAKASSLKSKGSIHRSSPSRRTKPGTGTAETSSLVKREEPEFAAGGLLGNAYAKLKQSDAASVASSGMAGANGPFTDAPSLLNGGISNSSSDASDQVLKQVEGQEKEPSDPVPWFPSAAEHSARIRTKPNHTQSPHHLRRPRTADAAGAAGASAARRERHPAPLLSFTKDFPEPPRFRDGPMGIRQVPGQPLVSYATGGAAREPRDGAPRRNVPRRGMPGSNFGDGFTSPPPRHPPPPPGSRARSKSNASQRRHEPGTAHPPMPAAPKRRPLHHGEPQGPPRYPPPEPLVTRAK